MNDVFYEEKLADIKEAIDVVFRFQLYRRGKIDEYEDGGKVLGDAIDTLLGCATEYQAIMEENKVLKNMYHEVKEKLHELDNKTNNTNNSNAFDIDGKCNYPIEKRTFIEDYMKGKRNEI